MSSSRLARRQRLWRNPGIVRTVVDKLQQRRHIDQKTDCVVGLEARDAGILESQQVHVREFGADAAPRRLVEALAELATWRPGVERDGALAFRRLDFEGQTVVTDPDTVDAPKRRCRK